MEGKRERGNIHPVPDLPSGERALSLEELIHKGDASIEDLKRNRSNFTPERFIELALEIAERLDAQFKEVLLQNAELRVEINKTELALAHAGIDKLTGLLVRDVFDRELSNLINGLSKKGQHRNIDAIVVIRLDIDDFKKFNEFGHITGGDKALATTGFRLREIDRGGDLISRYGGDEFVFALPVTTQNNVSVSNEEIEALFQSKKKRFHNQLFIEVDTSEHGKQKLPITAAMGYAVFRVGDEGKYKTLDDLMVAADFNQIKEKDPNIKRERMAKARAELGLEPEAE